MDFLKTTYAKLELESRSTEYPDDKEIDILQQKMGDLQREIVLTQQQIAKAYKTRQDKLKPKQELTGKLIRIREMVRYMSIVSHWHAFFSNQNPETALRFLNGNTSPLTCSEQEGVIVLNLQKFESKVAKPFYYVKEEGDVIFDVPLVCRLVQEGKTDEVNKHVAEFLFV